MPVLGPRVPARSDFVRGSVLAVSWMCHDTGFLIQGALCNRALEDRAQPDRSGIAVSRPVPLHELLKLRNLQRRSNNS